MGPIQFPFKNLSLQKRLPFLVCLLLTGTVTLFAVVSYFSIRSLEMKAGKDRLLDLTVQLANMFSEAIREDISSTKKAISGAAITAFIRDRNDLHLKQADNILQQIGNSGSSVFAEILDSNYQPLMSAGNPAHLPPQGNFSRNDKTQAGNMYSIHDSIFYSITLPVFESGKIQGYVTRYRFVKINSKMITQFSALAGYHAALRVGNKDNNFYTDLFKPVKYTLPVAQTLAGKDYSYKNNNGNKILGAFQFVPDTPWVVSLEFPFSLVVQGSSRFLFWLLILSAFVIACGGWVAWMMSRTLTRPLNQLIEATATLSSGRFAEVLVDRGDEVGKLARSFNEMTTSLKDARNGMEEKISEAEYLSAQLRKLTAHLQNVREEEGKRIAREMHDELGQLLTGFKMDIQLLKNQLPDHKAGRVAEHMQSMTGLVDDAIRFVRRLATQLREGPLDDLGLIAAIQWYIQDFTKRYNIPVNFRNSGHDLKSTPQVKTSLFRICQESLTNIARHAHATQVEINLDVNDTELFLTITDNGKGFKTNEERSKGSLGLLGMNERAIMIGANLSLHSVVGKGTTINVSAPLTEEQGKYPLASMVFMNKKRK